MKAHYCDWKELTVSDLASCLRVRSTGSRSSSSLSSLCLLGIGLIPFICHLFFPVRRLCDLIDTVFDDGEGLSHLIILHVLFIVKLVRELEEFIDLGLLLIFLLSFGHGPCRSGSCLLSFLGGNRGCFATLDRSRVGI